MRLILPLLISLTFAIPALASDGVLEINQTCAVNTGCFAGDAAGFPVSISESGSYGLTSNLVTGSPLSGLMISSDRVALDLHGFTIQGSGVPSIDVGIGGAGTRISISNGFIRDFSYGVSLSGSARIENLHISAYWKTIQAGGSSWLIDNRVDGGRAGSIVVSDLCRVEGNYIVGSSNGPGLVVGSGSIVHGNFLSGTRDGGIGATNSRVTGNIVSGGIFFGSAIVATGGLVSENVISSASGWGIIATNAVVSSNRISSTDSGGIRCSDCSVLGNVVSNSLGAGLDATGGTGTTGYEGNQFNGNNGGNGNPQVLGGVETGPNVCGGDLTCP